MHIVYFFKKNSMKNLEVIILAAGKGTRMKSGKPKILHTLGGKPIIDYVINASMLLKPKKIHLVVNNEIKVNFKNRNNINIVIQKKQNGTADALKSTLKSLNKNSVSLILYGDVPLISQKILKQISNTEDNCINVLCFNKEEKNNYGKVILGTDGLISEIIEQKELDRNDNFYLCNSGIFSIQTNLLKTLLPKISNDNKKKEYYLTDIFKLGSKQGVNIKPTITNETEVMGVNDKNDLAKAEKELQIRLRSKHLMSGVTMTDPDTVYFSSDTKIGKDVTIHPFVIIGKNVVIGNNTEIFAFSHIEDCKIGNEVSIGPYARVRPGTKLSNKTKIGNFVEIKNSKVSQGTKVNHLTYIGDTVIGKKVNVGAGTITCNYDGSSKFKTIIKDNVFVGSNTSLVAPLVVGKNAYIGSGSTITRNISENSLAIERTSQTEVKNWSNKKKGKK